MNNPQAATHLDVQQLYDYAKHLLLDQQQSIYEVRQALVERGLDLDSAQNVLTAIEDDLQHAEKERAQRDVLFGSLWLVGGIIATLAQVHFVFWGAIVIGAVLFGRGVVKMG
jgi:hypothetical protein